MLFHRYNPPTPATAAQVDARHDERAVAIVVTSEDRDSFALWYAHDALGERPDIAVAVGPLLDFPWYRASMRITYPWLRFPDVPPGDRAFALAATNDGPVCVTDPAAPPAIACAPHTPYQ